MAKESRSFSFKALDDVVDFGHEGDHLQDAGETGEEEEDVEEDLGLAGVGGDGFEEDEDGEVEEEACEGDGSGAVAVHCVAWYCEYFIMNWG